MSPRRPPSRSESCDCAARPGASAVEAAIVYPVAFFFVLGLVIGAMGIFRYQETASLAREAARYASVHGTNYAQASGQPAATAQDIYTNAIAPKAVGLDLSKLTYSVTWNRSNSPSQVVIVNGNVTYVTNTVTVTVTYQWIPEHYLGGVTLTSTSVAQMAF
jgi:Flp pilus assembly protein TadG